MSRVLVVGGSRARDWKIRYPRHNCHHHWPSKARNLSSKNYLVLEDEWWRSWRLQRRKQNSLWACGPTLGLLPDISFSTFGGRLCLWSRCQEAPEEGIPGMTMHFQEWKLIFLWNLFVGNAAVIPGLFVHCLPIREEVFLSNNPLSHFSGSPVHQQSWRRSEL